MKKQGDLTQGNILKGFCMFAVPLLFGSLFQQLYGTVDLLFVGNFLGTEAAAAVGASGILATCLIGLFTGISVGAGVVTAQYFGARDTKNVKNCMTNSILLGVTGGLLLTAAGLVLSEQALVWLNTPEEIMEQALVYLRLYLLAVVPMILYNMLAGIFRAVGDSRTPFYVLAVGGILNVGMDALFIAALKWGVAGAALATMISQSFTAVVLLVRLLRQEKLLRERLEVKPGLVRKILAIGFPLGIQSMILTLSNLFVQYYINGFGGNAVAAFTVYFKVENLIYLPIMAFGQAMVTFTGQNFGAGRYERIRSGAVSCVLFSAGVTAVIAACVLLGGRQIVGLFGSDQAMVEEGLKIIRVSFPFYFLYAVLEVTGGIVRGVGKSLQSMAIILINLCGARIVLLYVFVRIFHTTSAVAAVYPITWALTAAAFVCFYGILARRDFV